MHHEHTQDCETHELVFDGDNSYPDCEGCGHCCQLNIICVTPDELATMRAYVEAHDIKPIDQNKERCCFQLPDHRCMIWEARPQICRLHNCHVPRIEILRRNPDIIVPDDPALIDLHEAFFNGDFSDPRNR